MNGTASQYPQGTILDPSGNPFPLGGKFDGYAVPKVIQFSALVGSAWRKFWHEKHDTAMRHSREDAMAMRRDSSLMCLINERRRAVTILPWHIEVENEKDPHEMALKEGLTKIVGMISRFRKLLWCASDAVWYGRMGTQFRFAWKEMDMPAPASKLRVMMNPMLKDNPMSKPKQRRKCLIVKREDHDDGHMSINGDKIGHSYDGEPYVLVTGAYDNQLPPGLPQEWATLGRAAPLRGWMREQFMIHEFMEGIQDADFYSPMEADSIHGCGIRSFIYFLDYLKREWISNVTDWVERAGIGVRVWYYNAGNPASQKAVEAAAKANIHRTNILIPRYTDERGGVQEDMDWREPGGTGPELILRLIEYVEKWHERYIVGQTMSGGTKGKGGGLISGSAWAELASETKNDITESDSFSLAESVTFDLLNTIKKYTYPEYEEIPAYFRFGVERQKAENKMQAAKAAWEMGAGLLEDEVIDAIGFTKPMEGDAVLKKGPEPMPGQKPGFPPGNEKPDGSQGSQNPPDAAEEEEEPALQNYSRDYADAIAAAAKDTETNPSEEQKKSGNYRKGHVTLHGLNISIENPKGSTRSGKSKAGKEWSVTMANHYGYIKSTESDADGDHVDVFLGPTPESELVFIIDQMKADGSFDEHKCMIGFVSEEEAKDAYHANYSPGWKGFGGIKAMPIELFKKWIVGSGTGHPAEQQTMHYSRALMALAVHARDVPFGEGGILYRHLVSPELYSLDLTQFLERLKRINMPEAVALYRHLVNVLDRYPDLRREVGTGTLSTIRALAK
jgi:phage gp29-like protein